ncbi:SGNH/GDSL hydrolase family protein [Limosilactobacillus sp.]|uniref:SGNH/GDSL hydrolase family protein n=1 Tax=Limosilactobacillus sp. TaxID=2773925 RepID=UPI00345F0CDC
MVGIVIVMLIAATGYWFYLSRPSTAPQNHVHTHRQIKKVKKHIHLYAIGDSLTYGQGDEQKKGGYVSIVAHKIHHHYHTKVSTVNYGVSGDRSDQILYRLNHQKQMRHDLRKADVITMTVGGNDLMQTLEKIISTNSEKEINSDVAKSGNQYQQKLTKLMAAIRKENPRAPIFVLSIYNPVYTYFANVTSITRSIAQWNRITSETVGEDNNAYFVNIDHLMSYGQYHSKASRQKLVHAAQKSGTDQLSQKQVTSILNHKNQNLNNYISTEDNFHPNHRGYEKMADRLFKSMQHHNGWAYQKSEANK